jgi:hypothetical protein
LYGDLDRANFRAGDWEFVTVCVEPVIGGQTWPGAAFVIGSVEYGQNGNAWTVTADDIARRAVDDGWCNEALDALRKVAFRHISEHAEALRILANWLNADRHAQTQEKS